MEEIKINEQDKIVDYDNGDILVSASAGSGKTHTMIKRLVNIISEKKATVNQILCLTFTEASASEMKERLQKALISKIEQGDAVLSHELGDIQTADIGTIDGYCSKIVRKYFFVAGVSPDYSVADEGTAGQLKKQAVDKVFRKFYGEKDAKFLSVCSRYYKKRSDGFLKDVIISVLDFISCETDPIAFLSKSLDLYKKGAYIADKTKRLKEIKENIYKITDSLKELRIPFKDSGVKKFSDYLEEVIKFGEYLYSTEDWLYGEKNYTLSDMPKVSLEKQYDDSKAELKSLRDSLKDLYKESLYSDEEGEKIYANLRTETEEFIYVVSAVYDGYAQAKAEENVLDFSDLEHYALKVLSDENTQKEIKEKYKYIFIDDYQDVNAVQEEIMTKISNGNTFMVGDAKQSIYAFRGCRAEFFEKRKQAMKESGQAVFSLNNNYRSAKNIIDAVNQIFNYCMRKDFYGVDYQGEEQLVYGKTFPDNYQGEVYFHVINEQKQKEEKPEKTAVYDILEDVKREKKEEEQDTSALIGSIIEKELTKDYYSPKEKCFKKTDYKNIAIITRSVDNNDVKGLISGLMKRGIPVSSSIKENILNAKEIDAVINAFKLIDNFKQDIPLAVTMLGPFGGFTEDELAEISLFYRDSGKTGNFSDAFIYFLQNATSPLFKKVENFKAYYEDLREISDYIGAKGVLLKLIEDFNYTTLLLSSDQGNLKVKRLNMFLSLCEGKLGDITVSEMLDFTVSKEKMFEMSVCDDDNAVKIITMHSSKGLEYPVVICYGLEKEINKKDLSGELLLSRKYGVLVNKYYPESRKKEQPLIRKVVAKEMEEDLVREEMRLLYVALTRATNVLHMIACTDKDVRRETFTGKLTRRLEYLPTTINPIIHSQNELTFYNVKKEFRDVLTLDSYHAKDGLVSEMKKNFAFTYPFLSDTVAPLKKSVTGVLMQANDKAVSTEDMLFEKENIFVKFGTDTEKGTLAHRILELFDFSSHDSLDKQIEGFIENGLLKKEELNLDLSGIKKIVESDLFRNLQGDFYREKSFLVNVPANLIGLSASENVLLQGIIDLLVVGDSGAVIIDYKYSQKGSESLKATYKKQLELYKYAVEKSLNIKVVKTALVNIYYGDVIEMC